MTNKRVIIFVHAEQSPGDSGDPLACVSREDGKATWQYEILATGHKSTMHMSASSATTAAMIHLGLA